jgi:COP9 signalosome complex subunit 3
MKTAKGLDATIPSAAHRDSSGYITLRSGLSDKIQISHVQEYFVLGGMVYLGLKKYKEALMLFEYVISSPSTGIVSALMVEAFKKWILVGCLVTGKVGLSFNPR